MRIDQKNSQFLQWNFLIVIEWKKIQFHRSNKQLIKEEEWMWLQKRKIKKFFINFLSHLPNYIAIKLQEIIYG